MQVLIEDTNLLTWQFHDADIYAVNMSWNEDGEVSPHIFCEINPEENRDMLISMGITNSRVGIVFKDSYKIMVNIIGTCSGLEEIITWKVETYGLSSSKTETTESSLLMRNIIACSCGSTYDIVCRAMYIEDDN